ncbi:ABC transporter permease [Leucobacter sp. CSA1]|uniref:ABC transporter permease n=1 Tax=Leucobacter chromiisoli TaxID=2796471 RepID=A0A934Q6N2_9MICO|nr:ABC transporter permease [Leucobacter chromiisoli]MBK0418360.1 ABC transporter permease [Leucobacter chromiisoli]
MSEKTRAETRPAPQTGPVVETGGGSDSRWSSILRTVLTQRVLLVAILLIVMLAVMFSLDASGQMSGNYNAQYLASSLINVVPLVMLALAQLVVIVTGRGAIDLSVGSMVSLVSMIFGFAHGMWGVPLIPAIVLAIAAGGILGAVNGVLVAYLGFPPLIATLATYYAYWSIALVVNDQKPINSPEIQEMYQTARAIPIPGLSGFVPNIPLGIFLFLIPTVIVVWYLLNRAPYGRRLYATGTNDVAAEWAGINVAAVRMRAFVISGMISGLVAVVTVGQFASARPDAGTSGNGMALPAITIAVLGGVAITGGIGRVAGVVLAGLLVVWLNAGILLIFPGNHGTQYQLLALGVVLVFAALLNGYTNRRFQVLT